MATSWLLLTACCLLLGSVSCDVKTWTKNTNFGDPNNWSGGGLICSNDRKVYPKDMIASVFVQKNESLQELVLSDNMVLEIGEGAVLTFTTDIYSSGAQPTFSPPSASIKTDSVTQISSSTTERPSCSANGRVIEFQAKAASWFDPSSWSTQQKASKDDQRFLLDLESVPCSEDRVVFPSQNTFLADLENSNIMAGSMLIHKKELRSQAVFDSYWSGGNSPYEFVRRSTVTPAISGAPCGDDMSCPCKDRYTDEMKSRVCKFKECEDERVKKTCDQPLMPDYGQCCQLCGSKLRLNVSTPAAHFNFAGLHKQVIRALNGWRDVQYTFGPLIDSAMEVILKDSKGDGRSANGAVCLMRSRLLKNETAYLLGITDVTFERSDGVKECLAKAGTTLPTIRNRSGKWDNIIIGVSVAFALICILIVGFGVFLYRKKFAANGKNEMELGNVGSARSSQGFDNPVYDTPLPFEDSFTVSYDASGDHVNGFENALYTSGVDTEVSPVHGEIKKQVLEDPYAPVPRKTNRKLAGEKKSKKPKHVGFDNPVYSLNDGKEEGTGSMVSVPLDEDHTGLPAYVEHDGTGYANPIATGLSEEMMAPPLPSKEPLKEMKSKGFDNPLFGDESLAVADSQVEADLGEVTVHVAQPTKKKKAKNGKSKEHKSKKEVETEEFGFGNPLYGPDDEPQESKQPDSPGKDDSPIAPHEDRDDL